MVLGRSIPPHSIYVRHSFGEKDIDIFTGGLNTLQHNLYFDYKVNSIVADVKHCDIICNPSYLTIHSFTTILINVDIYGLTCPAH